MTIPRKLLFIGIFFALTAGLSSANDIYIAQNALGNGSGSDCADAKSYTFFNTSSNWGTGTGQIGPGTTVHVCGTFTGSAGGTMLKFQGSGTSANPITLYGEPGATFTAPYWSGDTVAGGAINTNGYSYLTINGGPDCGWSFKPIGLTPCNMTIINTQNGTGLPYAAASVGIVVGQGSTHVEIKNTDIHNIYVHEAGSSDDAANYTNQIAIFMAWQGAGTSNITIDHNVIHDGGWLINAGVDNIFIGPGNEIYNADHDIASAPIHGYIFGNHFHDWANWNGFGAHHDGFHCFAGSTGAGISQVLYVYNNQFDGDPGPSGLTGFVYLEGSGSPTTCMLPSATGIYVFNNVSILGNNVDAPFSLNGNSGGRMMNTYVVNNTAIGNQPTNPTSEGNYLFEYATPTFTNNTSGGLSILVADRSNDLWTGAPDNNFYENCVTGEPCFAARGVSSNSFSDWQNAGNDLHGGAGQSATNYFGLSSSCVPLSVGADCHPQSGSPLIGAGKNLYAVCSGQPNPGLGALCFDITGAPRPTTGSWDVGAYQYATATNPSPNPPTGLAASVQ